MGPHHFSQCKLFSKTSLSLNRKANGKTNTFSNNSSSLPNKFDVNNSFSSCELLYKLGY